jgi:hypothetical protein
LLRLTHFRFELNFVVLNRVRHQFFFFGSASKENSKEKEEISESMDKLHIEGSSSGQAGTSSPNFRRKPVIIIVVGMAGNI